MRLKSVVNAAAYGISTAALTFGLAANANALEIGCYDTPEKISAMKTQMVAENQAPIIKFFQNGSLDDASPKWEETIVTMNPKNATGHRITKAANGTFCVLSQMSSMQTFDNKTEQPEIGAYLTYPAANAQGTGINRVVHAAAMVDKELPMLRAVENIPQLKRQGITYILANGTTGKGSIVMASLQGDFIKGSTKTIPEALPPNVKHGAIYTDVGKDILSQRVASSGTGTPELLAQRTP